MHLDGALPKLKGALQAGRSGAGHADLSGPSAFSDRPRTSSLSAVHDSWQQNYLTCELYHQNIQHFKHLNKMNIHHQQIHLRFKYASWMSSLDKGI